MDLPIMFLIDGPGKGQHLGSQKGIRRNLGLRNLNM